MSLNGGTIEKRLNNNSTFMWQDQPFDSDMWSNLGTLRRMNKQYKKSLNAFNRAIQIKPNNFFYYNARLKTYYEMGDIQRARDDLNFLKSKGFKDISPDYERMINQGR